MAVIDFSFEQEGDTAKVSWLTMDGSDTGQPFKLGNYNSNTVTITGTFDSNSLTMQGSNDGTNWYTLTADPDGADIALSAAGINKIAEAPGYIRPSLGAGANSDIDVIVKLRTS